VSALAALLAVAVAAGVRMPTRRSTPIALACRAMVASAVADRSWRDEYRAAYAGRGLMARVRADVAGARWAA
jgi:hypothetical protein